MEELYHKHYIRLDDQGRVIKVWSDGPRPDEDTAGAICINNRGGYQFRLAPDGEENPPIMEGRIPLYQWDGQRVVRRSDEEVEADRQRFLAERTAKPSASERLEAQVTYTAMMTDTLLEV